VLFLIDGLGAQALEDYRDYAPTISAMRSLAPLRSEFPSTTATSLTSIGTGLHPAEHGMLGYTVRIPHSDNRLLNALKWDSRVDPVIWQPHQTLFEQGAKAGINIFNISAERYAGSGFTEAALRGATFLGANTIDLMVAQLRIATSKRPCFVYFYLNDVDAAGHDAGVGSEKWLEALALVDDCVALVQEALPAGSRLTITSDHGMITAEEKILIDGKLAQEITLIGGEPRARHLYVDEGRSESVAERWRSELSAKAQVYTKAAALEAGIFGVNPTEQTKDRMGDLVVIAQEKVVFIEPARKHLEGEMVGYHGGDTDVERDIPLLGTFIDSRS
jgi:predicted AlkP superfamily pyrophosphatase or phosphodiesterase